MLYNDGEDMKYLLFIFLLEVVSLPELSLMNIGNFKIILMLRMVNQQITLLVQLNMVEYVP